jgi:hypothetical protein
MLVAKIKLNKITAQCCAIIYRIELLLNGIPPTPNIAFKYPAVCVRFSPANICIYFGNRFLQYSHIASSSCLVSPKYLQGGNCYAPIVE